MVVHDISDVLWQIRIRQLSLGSREQIDHNDFRQTGHTDGRFHNLAGTQEAPFDVGNV